MKLTRLESHPAGSADGLVDGDASGLGLAVLVVVRVALLVVDRHALLDVLHHRNRFRIFTTLLTFRLLGLTSDRYGHLIANLEKFTFFGSK